MLSNLMGKTQKTKDKEQRINQSWEQSSKDQKVWEERRVVIEKAAAEAKAKVATEAKEKAESDAKEKVALEAKAKAAAEAREKTESDARIKTEINTFSEIESLWKWNIEYLILEISMPSAADLGYLRLYNVSGAKIDGPINPEWRLDYTPESQKKMGQEQSRYRKGIAPPKFDAYPKRLAMYSVLVKAEKKLADIQAKKAALIKSLEGNNTTTNRRPVAEYGLGWRGGRTKKRHYKHPKKGMRSRTRKKRKSRTHKRR
jgi:hypothetical protein